MTEIELLAQRAGKKAARAEAGFFEQPSIDTVRSAIDHTLLSSWATTADIEKLCREAVENSFASVCVPLSLTPAAAAALSGSDVKTSTVVGFPLGSQPLSIKEAETLWAIDNGADEIDAVLSIRHLLENDKPSVREEILALREASAGKTLKLILELPLVSNDQAVMAVRIAEQTGVDFLKTGTGYNGGATFFDVAFLRTVASDGLLVKASGGIRTLAAAKIMVALGAKRLGTSAALEFLPQVQ